MAKNNKIRIKINWGDFYIAFEMREPIDKKAVIDVFKQGLDKLEQAQKEQNDTEKGQK